MEILKETCTGCEICLPYCVVGAIKMDDGTASIESDQCVECGTCFINAPCPTDAFRRQDLPWPRVLRQLYSDNLAPVPKTPGTGGGRGIMEVKINDRTNYYKPEEVGFFIEMGRPGVSASMRDVEKMIQAFASRGYKLAGHIPIASLVADPKTGDLKSDILMERVLYCTLEFRGTLDDVPEMIGVLREVEDKVDTVFSVGVLSSFSPPYAIPVMPLLADLGIPVKPNAKINVGSRPADKSKIGGRR